MHDAAVGGMLGRGAHREFIAIGLAGDEGARGFQLGDRGRLVGRPIALENPGAARRREFERADVVLHRHRHSVEHAGGARGGGLREQRLAKIFGWGEQRVEALGFHQAVGDRFRVTHSNWPSFGTTKKPSLKTGANSSGPNASGAGATSSARNRIASGPGTNVFTLPFVGIALSCAT